MTEEETQKELDIINNMTHFEMAQLWRFAPVGHPYFVTNSVLSKAFDKRFAEFGRFTPEISKLIGWSE